MLTTSYSVVLENHQLVMQHQRHSDIPLTPVTVGRFNGNQWWATQLIFQSGEDGVITGFTLSSGRVQGLHFVKKSGSIGS